MVSFMSRDCHLDLLKQHRERILLTKRWPLLLSAVSGSGRVSGALATMTSLSAVLARPCERLSPPQKTLYCHLLDSCHYTSLHSKSTHSLKCGILVQGTTCTAVCGGISDFALFFSVLYSGWGGALKTSVLAFPPMPSLMLAKASVS